MIPGQTYTLVADGATDDEFGMGAYRLDVEFTGGDTPSVSDATAPETPSEILPTTDADDSSDPAIEPDQNDDATGDTAPATPDADSGDTTPAADPSGSREGTSAATPQTDNDSQSERTYSESGLLLIRVTRRRLLASGGDGGSGNEPAPATQTESAELQQTRTGPSLADQLASGTQPATEVEVNDTEPDDPQVPGNPQDAADTTELPPNGPTPNPQSEDEQPATGDEQQDTSDPTPSDAETPATPPPSPPPLVTENTPQPATQPVVIRVTRRGTAVTSQTTEPSNGSPETDINTPENSTDAAVPAAPTVPAEPVTPDPADSDAPPNETGPVTESEDPADGNSAEVPPDAASSGTGEDPANTETPPLQPQSASPESELPRGIGLELLIASATTSTTTQERVVSPRLRPNLVDLAIHELSEDDPLEDDDEMDAFAPARLMAYLSR